MKPHAMEFARKIAAAPNAGIGCGFTPENHRLFCALLALVDRQAAEVSQLAATVLAQRETIDAASADARWSKECWG
jgi:hypothetical protein